MRRIVLYMAAIFLLQACNKDNTPPAQPGTGTTPPADVVLLKDIVYSSLPSPYYHFEYNTADKISKASFASDLAVYQVSYAGNNISEVKQINGSNHDRIEYTYDNGKPVIAKYIKTDGTNYLNVFFNYTAEGKLSSMEWDMKSGDIGFLVYKEINFTYYTDGNLMDMTFHYHDIDGIQTATTFTDHYENYDSNKNADEFTLYQEFNIHTLLLPQIKLQQNNPGKVTRTGSASLTYEINYTYTYNSNKFPLNKNGMLKITSGPDTGKVFSISAQFSYY